MGSAVFKFCTAESVPSRVSVVVSLCSSHGRVLSVIALHRQLLRRWDVMPFGHRSAPPSINTQLLRTGQPQNSSRHETKLSFERLSIRVKACLAPFK
eukprot:2197746-Amphidinium_carterae.1